MQAVRFNEHGGPGVLRVDTLPDPVLTPNGILVKMKTAALNHLDLWVRQGIRSLKLPLPHIPGSDGAGVILAVGADVTGWQVGDEVVVQPGTFCGHCAACMAGRQDLCQAYGILGETEPGVMQTLCVFKPVNLGRKPAALNWETAAALPLAYLTAWNMIVNRAQLQSGEIILVQGAGSGVGMAAIQIAKHLGATVIAATRTARKQKLATSIGADFTIDSAQSDVSRVVKTLTQGKGADVVFEHVGEATWQASLRSLAFAGRLVTCGATTGPHAEIEIRHLFAKRLSILGSTMGSVGDFEAVLDLAAQNILVPLVDRVFPMSDIAAAHAYLAKDHEFGKVVIRLEP